ncbi:phospholipase A2 [Kitasatospora sp. NPDC051164]|uniref:phospholipase A2 n=1 Tax=Kitasatospora sp. NPDC051164 TaxID=3364055 RepID=UPI00378D2D61
MPHPDSDVGEPVRLDVPSPAGAAQVGARADHPAQVPQPLGAPRPGEYWAHKLHKPDRYGFNWDTNVCNSPAPDRIDGFDFSLACIRHDFGYHNSKDLYGEDGFRNSLTGPSPKARVDGVFLQDLTEACETPSRPRVHTTAEREACHRIAGSYYSAVVLSRG